MVRVMGELGPSIVGHADFLNSSGLERVMSYEAWQKASSALWDRIKNPGDASDNLRRGHALDVDGAPPELLAQLDRQFAPFGAGADMTLEDLTEAAHRRRESTVDDELTWRTELYMEPDGINHDSLDPTPGFDRAAGERTDLSFFRGGDLEGRDNVLGEIQHLLAHRDVRGPIANYQPDFEREETALGVRERRNLALKVLTESPAIFRNDDPVNAPMRRYLSGLPHERIQSELNDHIVHSLRNDPTYAAKLINHPRHGLLVNRIIVGNTMEEAQSFALAAHAVMVEAIGRDSMRGFKKEDRVPVARFVERVLTAGDDSLIQQRLAEIHKKGSPYLTRDGDLDVKAIHEEIGKDPDLLQHNMLASYLLTGTRSLAVVLRNEGPVTEDEIAAITRKTEHLHRLAGIAEVNVVSERPDNREITTRLEGALRRSNFLVSQGANVTVYNSAIDRSSADDMMDLEQRMNGATAVLNVGGPADVLEMAQNAGTAILPLVALDRKSDKVPLRSQPMTLMITGGTFATRSVADPKDERVVNAEKRSIEKELDYLSEIGPIARIYVPSTGTGHVAAEIAAARGIEVGRIPPLDTSMMRKSLMQIADEDPHGLTGQYAAEVINKNHEGRFNRPTFQQLIHMRDREAMNAIAPDVVLAFGQAPDIRRAATMLMLPYRNIQFGEDMTRAMTNYRPLDFTPDFLSKYDSPPQGRPSHVTDLYRRNEVLVPFGEIELHIKGQRTYSLQNALIMALAQDPDPALLKQYAHLTKTSAKSVMNDIINKEVSTPTGFDWARLDGAIDEVMDAASKNPRFNQAVIETGRSQLTFVNNWGDKTLGSSQQGEGFNAWGKGIERLRSKLRGQIDDNATVYTAECSHGTYTVFCDTSNTVGAAIGLAYAERQRNGAIGEKWVGIRKRGELEAAGADITNRAGLLEDLAAIAEDDNRVRAGLIDRQRDVERVATTFKPQHFADWQLNAPDPAAVAR